MGKQAVKQDFFNQIKVKWSCCHWRLLDKNPDRVGGCSSVGRAGRLVIGRSLVQIPAPGRAELHVEVSLSEILNPTLLISEGPVMSWRLVQEYPALALRQGWDWLKQQSTCCLHHREPEQVIANENRHTSPFSLFPLLSSLKPCNYSTRVGTGLAVLALLNHNMSRHCQVFKK